MGARAGLDVLQKGKTPSLPGIEPSDRPVPGLDILPATVFREVGIEVLCTIQMNYSRHWLSVSGLDCQW